jgi:MFS family permease
LRLKTAHGLRPQTIIAGAGFMADAYDLFVINVAVDIMGSANYAQKLSTETESLVKGMALLGAILGQLVFGFFADQIGRHRIFLTTGMISVRRVEAFIHVFCVRCRCLHYRWRSIECISRRQSDFWYLFSTHALPIYVGERRDLLEVYVHCNLVQC